MNQKFIRYLIAGACLLLCQDFMAQLNPTNDGSDPCSVNLRVINASNGSMTLCNDGQGAAPWNYSSFSMTCSADDGTAMSSSSGVHASSCLTIPCCESEDGLVFTWTMNNAEETSYCTYLVTQSCCDGPDADGDGICDENDCWPEDPNQSYGPGDECDDGDPLTHHSYYDEDCNCVGWSEGCRLGDSDGDGVCDEDDCWPDDSSQAGGPGDFCNDGDPDTYNDRYTVDCECIGTPIPCGDVNPNDGCPLTVDLINADCSVTNVPPDPDDGCDLTYDYFDAENCIVVNEVPDVDDGCSGTRDYFDIYNCEIIHEALPCDDGDPATVGDKYNDGCECQGCDPCQLEGEKWNLLCELLNR